MLRKLLIILVGFLFLFCFAKNLKALVSFPVSFKGSSNVRRLCGSSLCRGVWSSARNVLQRNAEGPQHLLTSHGKAAKYLGHSLWSTWFGVRWGGMTTARLHLNTSGTVCVNKDFFHFAFFFFWTLFLLMVSFQTQRVLWMCLGKGMYVVGLFGFSLCLVCVEMQRYCLSLDYNSVVMNVFWWLLSTVRAYPLLFTS